MESLRQLFDILNELAISLFLIQDITFHAVYNIVPFTLHKDNVCRK